MWHFAMLEERKMEGGEERFISIHTAQVAANGRNVIPKNSPLTFLFLIFLLHRLKAA